MGKKKKKSKAAKVEWKQLLVQAAIDFLVGFLLLIAERLLK